MKRRPPSRRDFLRAAAGAAAAAGASLGAFGCAGSGRSGRTTAGRAALAKPACFSSRPNVLYITLDDQNDWLSPFGGYPGAKTPNADRVASWGVSFQRAYCAVPHCGGSRSATLTGIAAYRSKHYENANILEATNKQAAIQHLGIADFTTLPRYFKTVLGYSTIGGGKVFHGGYGGGASAYQGWEYDSPAWDDYFVHDWNAVRNVYPDQPNYGRRFASYDPDVIDGRLPACVGDAYNLPEQEALTPDRAMATWAADKFGALAASSTPFFMALGFFRPHFAWLVPKRFYDLYPLAGVTVPDFLREERTLVGLPPFAKQWVVEQQWTADEIAGMTDPTSKTDHYELAKMPLVDGCGGHAQAIRAYLASMSFADACLGLVLDALEAAGLRQSTIIVLWGDNGWHLGEKLAWRKDRVWERAARVPFTICIPGGHAGVSCRSVVSMVDLYPTLVDLVQGGMPPRLPAGDQSLDGATLRRLIEDPSTPWDWGAITSHLITWSGQHAEVHSLRTNDWRYIAYPEDSGGLTEELYNLTTEPEERTNLLYSNWDQYQDVRLVLRKLLLSRVGIPSRLP